ncbi:MAG: MATE family efflux transporter [Clostridiales bacterium]|nr:MATE family efflux transporter [Candidatus Blautia equi]
MDFLKKMFAPVDMTDGRPWEKILLFTVPMLVGNIAQQLYSTVDSVVVGKYVGDNALAAVGSAGPILNLLIVLFVGISMGASIMVSQYFGARDRESLSFTIGNCITLTAIAGAFVMIVGTLVARPMLVLLNTPESILDWCTSYLQILFLGALGSAFYNILSGILRGLGDSISALIYLVVASVLNIILDLVFVATFHMGVSGVALATIIAQAISAFLCFMKLMRMKNLFDINKGYMKWNKNYANNIIRLGVPSGVTQAIISMSMIIVQSLTNSFGEQFIAANVIVMRVDGFAMLPNFSFGVALTTYAGQNIGAGNLERVKQGSKQGTLLAVVTSACITGLILLFGHHIMGLFTNTEDLVQLSMHMMQILAAGYIAMAIMQTLSGVMRGAGDTMTPMWISIFQTVVLRMPLAYGLCYLTRSAANPIGNKYMIQVSLLLTWLITMCITIFFYSRGKWKNMGINRKKEA